MTTPEDWANAQRIGGGSKSRRMKATALARAKQAAQMVSPNIGSWFNSANGSPGTPTTEMWTLTPGASTAENRTWWSEDITNASWFKYRCSSTATDITCNDDTNKTAGFENDSSLDAFTGTVVVKSRVTYVNHDFVELSVISSNSGNYYVGMFDLSAGTFLGWATNLPFDGGPGTAGIIEEISPGVYDISIVGDVANTGWWSCGVELVGSGDLDRSQVPNVSIGASVGVTRVQVYDAAASDGTYAKTEATLTFADPSVLDILSLPDAGDSAITGIEYRHRQEGAWGAATDSGRVDPFTGTDDVPGSNGDGYQWRCVNAQGAGRWSDIKVIEAATLEITAVSIDQLPDPDEINIDYSGTGQCYVMFNKTETYASIAAAQAVYDDTGTTDDFKDDFPIETPHQVDTGLEGAGYFLHCWGNAGAVQTESGVDFPVVPTGLAVIQSEQIFVLSSPDFINADTPQVSSAFTVDAGSNRLLAVPVILYTNSSPVSAPPEVKYGDKVMNLAASAQPQNRVWVGLFTLTDADVIPTGSNAVTITPANTYRGAAMMQYTYTGADQSTPTNFGVDSLAYNTVASVVVTGATAENSVIAFGAGSSNGTSQLDITLVETDFRIPDLGGNTGTTNNEDFGYIAGYELDIAAGDNTKTFTLSAVTTGGSYIAVEIRKA